MVVKDGKTVRVGIAMLAALVWIASGCSETPTPLEQSSSPVSILQRQARGKPAGDDVIEDSVKVGPTRGGAVLVGDEAIGNSRLDVPEDAVDDEETVHLMKMKVRRLGDVAAELRPHGLRFKRAVMLELSYKGADLTGVDESKLAIFYYNEDTQVWELVPGSVAYPDKKVVRAPLWHFSRYAIGGNG